MENNFNLSSLSDAELNEFYVNAAKEISARRERKSQNTWDKMVSAIKEYLKVDDNIIINCEGKEFYLNESNVVFNELGTIIIF